MSEKRIHGKATLDPQEYVWVAAGDNNPPTPDFGTGLFAYVALANEHRARWEAHRALLDGKSMSHCTHCGAAIRYYNIWKHLPTGEHIVTGDICATERLEAPDRAAVESRLVRMAAAHRAEMERVHSLAIRWQDEHAGLWARMQDARGDRFAASMIEAVWKYGSLTERQFAAVGPALDKIAEWTEPGAVCELREKVAAPEGVVEIEGEIIRAEWRDTQYGDKLVATVDAGGWRAWGTVPRALIDAAVTKANEERDEGARWIDAEQALKGARVRFTANVERSERDASFAFFRRPRKAALL